MLRLRDVSLHLALRLEIPVLDVVRDAAQGALTALETVTVLECRLLGFTFLSLALPVYALGLFTRAPASFAHV